MTGGVGQAPHPGTGFDMQHLWGPIPALPVRLILGVQPELPPGLQWEVLEGRMRGGILRTTGKPEKLQGRNSWTLTGSVSSQE